MLIFIAPYCVAIRLLSSFIPKSETLDTTIKKIQAIPMKAAAGNHQILSLPIVSQRPIAATDVSTLTDSHRMHTGLSV